MRTQKFEDIVLEMLTIANYRNNKEEYIKEFESHNYAETMLNMLDTLPEHQQHMVKEKLKNYNEFDFKTSIANLIPQEVFQKELNSVRALALKGLMNALLPTLSSEQIRKMDNLLSSQIAY